MPTENETTWVSAAALAIVAGVAAGLFFINRPLESRRPNPGISVRQAVFGDELVMARLWQDPLHAVQNHWFELIEYVEQRRTLPLSVELPRTIRMFPRELTDLRLLVTMPSTPYVEDRENRRRQRHAVVSALTAQGFEPEDPEHVGYFLMPRLAAASEDPTHPCDGRYRSGRCVALVGFENYRNDASALVQVLWLSADDLADLDQIAALLAAVRHPIDRPAVLLGPFTSGALLDMTHALQPPTTTSPAADPIDIANSLNQFPTNAATVLCPPRAPDFSWFRPPPRPEDCGPRRLGTMPLVTEPITSNAIIDQRQNLRILSAWATAPLHLLYDRDTYRIDSTADGHRVEQSLAVELGVRSFRSVVARDDLVLREILAELRARGACRGGSPRIAIVSEEDTAYGRMFSRIIRELPSRFPGELCDFQTDTYGYLRGLDGELPPPSLSARQRTADTYDMPPPTGDYDIPLASTPNREPAVGVARFDYVRRLANLISQRDTLRDRSRWSRFSDFIRGTRQPVAVGVLGSDVYDKLLILQALRTRLPTALFFTTDLDARLVDPANYPIARNLLVGSTYGFAVYTERPQRLSGFRSAYEAGLYRGVTGVLQWHRDGGAEVDYPGLVSTPCPRVFEIARTGVVDITPVRSECPDSRQVDGGALDVRSRAGMLPSFMRTLVLLAPLLCLTAVAARMSRVLPDELRDRRRAHGIVVRLGMVGVGLLGITTWYGTLHEPWVFFEGVSSVPALVLQGTTVLFAVCFGIVTAGRVVQGHKNVATKFRLSKPCDLERRTVSQVWENGPWISGWIRARREKGRGLWVEYLLRNQWRARLVRVAGPVVLVGAVVAIALMADRLGPYLIRGLRVPVELGTSLVIVAVLTSVFWCVDVLNMARAFIRGLVEGEPLQRGIDEAEGFVAARQRRMMIIVEFTDALGPIMVLPFVLLLLPIAAANTVSEGWIWSWSHIATYVIFTLGVLVCALQFQFEALRAKETILEELGSRRGELDDGCPEARSLDVAADEIRKIKEGAFVPWTRQPVVQSIGASGIAILTLVSALL